MLQTIFELFNAALTLSLLGVGVYYFFGLRRRCPACRKLFARTTYNIEKVGSNILSGRRDEVFTYQCNQCDHSWKVEKSRYVD